MIGIANLVFTLVGMALIDRLGRKTLLLAGAAGMTLCLAAAAGVLFGALGTGLMLPALIGFIAFFATSQGAVIKSEEHTSELQSLMRSSYAVFCLKNKK